MIQDDKNRRWLLVKRQIERLKPEDYIYAFEKIKLTDHQKKMLQTHLDAKNHMISARQMAKILGYANWNSTNLHYGKLAGKISAELGISSPTNLAVLVEFVKPKNSEYQLCLRPAVVDALHALGFSQDRSIPIPQEEWEPEQYFIEGSTLTVQINAFERNAEARKACIAYYGKTCSICGFNFQEQYGAAGENYIHVHHLKALSSINKSYKVNPIKDLRPVCANCHAIIHRRNPPYSIEEMKYLINKK
ncbi:MAG: HNH endonuclease [Neisseria sp.]|nr:HNH endonuclease [Neisseria sp.]